MSHKRLLAILILSTLLLSMVFLPLTHNTKAAPFTITVSGNVLDASGAPAPINTSVNITIYDGAAIHSSYSTQVIDSYGFYYHDSVVADYDFNISVNASFSSFYDESNTTVVFGKASYVIHLGQVIYDNTISQPPDDSGDPGQTLSYTFAITNTGNVKDRYSLSVTSQSDWSVAISSSNSTGVLMPGDLEYADATVTIPANAMVGDEDTITLGADTYVILRATPESANVPYNLIASKITV